MLLLQTIILQNSIILNRFYMTNVISYTFVYMKKIKCMIFFPVVHTFLHILNNKVKYYGKAIPHHIKSVYLGKWILSKNYGACSLYTHIHIHEHTDVHTHYFLFIFTQLCVRIPLYFLHHRIGHQEHENDWMSARVDAYTSGGRGALPCGWNARVLSWDAWILSSFY